MAKEIKNESMLPMGTILSGRYRIDRYISSGGFGNTYAATNIKFGGVVAIKEFFINTVSQREQDSVTVRVSNITNNELFEQQMQKFNKEAQRIYKIKNPHIVGVQDLFDENGTAYYVMDYIDGESLAERMERLGRPLTENEVRVFLPQVLDGLKAVHDAGFFHLDLKPANIMVDKTDRARLIDFGASKQEDSEGGAKASSLVCYTEGFAPIEQSEQNIKKFGPWTDIYALGATLYNLLTGRRPPTTTDIEDDPTPDKSLTLQFPSATSRQMRDLIRWMMALRRNERPQNVQQILDYLQKNTADTPPVSTGNERTKIGGNIANTGNTGSGSYITGNAGNTGAGPFITGNAGNTGAGPYTTGNAGNTGAGPYITGNAGNTGAGPYITGNAGNTGTVPPPSRKKSKLPIILAAIVGLLVLGGIAIFALSNAGGADTEMAANTTANNSPVVIVRFVGDKIEYYKLRADGSDYTIVEQDTEFKAGTEQVNSATTKDIDIEMLISDKIFNNRNVRCAFIAEQNYKGTVALNMFANVLQTNNLGEIEFYNPRDYSSARDKSIIEYARRRFPIEQ